MAAAIVAVLAVVAILVAGLAVRLATDPLADPTAASASPTAPAVPMAPAPAPELTTPTPTPTPDPPTPQESFHNGEREQPLPDPVPLSTALPPFTDQYPDPTDWLASTGVTGITVIPTDDPTLNCGLTDGNITYAGCYQDQHRMVVFVWWNADSSEAERTFLVAHEFSHWVQWDRYFDVIYAAAQQGFNGTPDWRGLLESDASCRVLSWGGYDESVVASSSTPCTTEGWYEGWFLDRARAIGVQF
ncbi:M78 family metallopeptidase domain-containing protein [Serinibacter arcticus]|uniref:Uncharacterized protein n=1 Tax=Serinibacter arcticus TaxID=1655435 RepID=A0A4Z1DZM7_9MICO|nr:hypothetical protein [Serinibacter arcticus]TGO04490.1 hypothetical protein SERN_2083 [Serinibacter arcticus]